MINKNDNPDLVIWDDKYDTGIELIDNQHKELCSLTNELFHACLDKK
jgi:hemerythrin